MSIAGSPRAQLVVNEVLANEPGSTTSLEWIELYNVGEATSLNDYSLRIGDNFIALPADVTLAESEYFIICRRLYATSISPGFESCWGDSSGVWGDSPYESSLQVPFEVAMSLTNDSGCVELMWGGTVVDSFTWNGSGLDGYSWERVRPQTDSIGQSVDLTGSTPGFLNSLTPAQYDLALTAITVRSDKGNTLVSLEISNVGQERIGSSLLYLIITAAIPHDTVDVVTIEAIEPDDAIVVDRDYTFSGTYLSAIAAVSDDDRNRNNTVEFICPGEDYPPLMLSEFLANPQGNLTSEWVELKNRSLQPVDLADWLIGDILRVNSICDESILIEPDEYIILAQDSTAFLAYYHDFNGTCLEPPSWASLNNDGDRVRLVDCFGIEADRFGYDLTYDANQTWCRTEEPLEFSQWGRSETSGGTPGEPNEVILSHQSSELNVTIDPPYVSPDGDGFEDVTTIKVEAPVADSYTVKIYDRQGRVVRSFYDEESMIPSEIEWDGLSDAGRRLPVGLYIVYVEASGVESTRKPVVVAR